MKQGLRHSGSGKGIRLFAVDLQSRILEASAQLAIIWSGPLKRGPGHPWKLSRIDSMDDSIMNMTQEARGGGEFRDTNVKIQF